MHELDLTIHETTTNPDNSIARAGEFARLFLKTPTGELLATIEVSVDDDNFADAISVYVTSHTGMPVSVESRWRAA